MKILLIHGAGASPRNAGDDAQAYAAAARLKRIIPNCEVIKARIYLEDDGSLWPHEDLVVSPHIYLLRNSRVICTLHGFLSGLRFRRIAALAVQLSIARRVGCLLLAARFKRVFGINPLINSTGRKVIDTISEVDAVNFSGGGNMNDTWFRTELLPRAVTCRVAYNLGKPVIFSGQGVGPLKSRLGRAILAWGVRHVDLFACRDRSKSEDTLLELGLKSEQVESLGDDATDLEPASPDRARTILAAEGVPVSETPIIAVHVRFTNYTSDFRKSGIPFVSELCDRLIEETGCRILFIPISYAKDRSYDRDIGDAFEVYSHMKSRQSVSFLCRERYLPPEIKAVISEATALIGFSYHSWIFSLTSGNPTFGLYNGDYFRMKSGGLFAWYNRGDWVWDISNATTSEIVESVVRAIKDPDSVRSSLDKVTDQISEAISTPAKLLAKSAMRDSSLAVDVNE